MKKTFYAQFMIITLIIFVFLSGVGIGTPELNATGQRSGKIKKGSAEYYLNEGVFYLNSGNLKMAEKRLLKALKKKPTMIPAINALGIVYLNKRDFQNAIKYFTQVVRTNPQFYDAYNYLGVVYTEMGEYNLAKENLLVAANGPTYMTPENAYANLANLEIRNKKYQSAVRYVNKGMEKNDRFAPLSNLKGIILEKEEKYKDAILWYKRALSLLTEPEVTYLVNIGRVYSKMGEKEKALDTLEKALARAFAPQIKKEIHKMMADLQK